MCEAKDEVQCTFLIHHDYVHMFKQHLFCYHSSNLIFLFFFFSSHCLGRVDHFISVAMYQYTDMCHVFINITEALIDFIVLLCLLFMKF